MNATENGIAEMYRGMHSIAQNGGYRERKELLEALEPCTWFDNFGQEYYSRRLEVIRIVLENGIQKEDIPEYILEEIEGMDELNDLL